MAAGAGLLLLAVTVVVLHFVSALALTAVEGENIIYENGRGVLREVLRICGQRRWQLTELDADRYDIDDGEVAVRMTLTGAKTAQAQETFARLDGVVAVLMAGDEAD